MTLMHIDAYSDALNRAARLDVILPAEQSGAKFRTLYLLHGMTDDQTIWQRRTSIERYADERGLAVVMPCTELNWYTDTHAGERWFTYIADELPKIARRMLPRLSERREDTFVAGLSMGGYGALKCALQRPDTFCGAASLSGGLDARAVVKPETDDFGTLDPHAVDLMSYKQLWLDIFGPYESIEGSANDLFRAAELCTNRPRVFMWCGTEDFLYTQNIRMRDHLRKLNYDLCSTESAGNHEWHCWDVQIQHALDWLLYGREAE